MERTKMIRMAEKLDAFFRAMEKVTVIAAVVMVGVMAVLTAVTLPVPKRAMTRALRMLEVIVPQVTITGGTGVSKVAPGHISFFIYTSIF